jgi:hypothetical protein
MGGNSDGVVPTEKAIVTYVTTQLASGAAEGFRLKDANNNTVLTVDTNEDGSSDTVDVTINSTLVSQIADQYILIPKGTTAERPGSPVSGYLRFNTTTGSLEVYTGTNWNPVGGLTNVDVSTTYTASASQLLWCDTSAGGFTLTLPASPSKGDTIRIIDVSNTFDTNNLTIDRNSQLIMGAADNLTVSTEGAAFDLIYYNSSKGWRIFTI